MEAGAEALHVRLDQLEHLEQFAVGEQHLAVVIGDADHGVQIVQRLDHELAVAQALLHHVEAEGELVLGGLQGAQQRREFAAGAARVQALEAAFADDGNGGDCLVELGGSAPARPPLQPRTGGAEHQ